MILLIGLVLAIVLMVAFILGIISIVIVGDWQKYEK